MFSSLPAPILREKYDSTKSATALGTPTAYRLSWARLLARVFRVDVTECPACGGKMKVIAALTDALAIRTYLYGIGLPSRAPPIAPPRRLPQTEFEYAY